MPTTARSNLRFLFVTEILQKTKVHSELRNGLYIINILNYFASSILKTALQQIKAPTKRITQDTIDKMVESNAKRKNTPIILTITPTAINMYIGD